MTQFVKPYMTCMLRYVFIYTDIPAMQISTNLCCEDKNNYIHTTPRRHISHPVTWSDSTMHCITHILLPPMVQQLAMFHPTRTAKTADGPTTLQHPPLPSSA